MRAFARRRYANALIVVLGAAAVVAAQASTPPLHRLHSFTGWILTASIAVLALFNMRKKLPMLPLLTAAAWLQLHIYVGLFAATVFVVHTGLRYPGGVYNQLLWWFFAALTASGIFGIWVERAIAPRLRDRGEAILVDRINGYRLRLAAEAQQIAGRSAAELGSPLLIDVYCNQIAPFMARPHNFWAHLVGLRTPIDRFTDELATLERYLNPQGRDTLHELQERVVAKDNLDHQYALMRVLRGWLFLHIPLAYGILPLIVGHIVLVYAFGGF